MFLYKCTQCGKEYKRNEVRYLCPFCSVDYKPGMPLKGVLSAEFDYDFVRKYYSQGGNFSDYLCAVEKKFFPDYPAGNTPFFKSDKLGSLTGFKNLWIKNDGLNPSGSLKDRASFLVVAEANRIKEKKIVTASTGNAASALAAVCASGYNKAVIFVPESAPPAKLVQMYLYGAEVITVKGTYDDAFKLSLEYTEKHGGLNRNTAYHPLTIEGKKTAGFEIFIQNGNKLPDVIFVSAGDGVIISGIFKAFYDLKKSGIIKKLPRLACVQAKNSSAIHNFILTGKYKDAKNPATIADSISVRTPSNAYLARKAVIESGGFSVTVTDDEIMKSQYLLARSSGVFAEPSAAATLAGLIKIKNSGKINSKEQVVLLITGNGLKDINSPMKYLKLKKII